MKRILLTVVVAAVFVTGAILVLQASEPETRLATFTPKVQSDREVSLQEIPVAVRNTILREASGHEISEVEEITTESGLYYEADWMADGREVELQVSPSGEILDRGYGDDEKGDDDEGDDAADDDDNR